MICSSPKRRPGPRWIKAWVPQPLVASGGKCSLLKWIREDTLKDLEEKDLELEETKPESTTEVLFLCSYDGCGKTFIDAADIRKHAATHGERRHAATHGERKHADIHGERKHADTHGERKHADTHGERNHAATHGKRKHADHADTHGERKHADTHGERKHADTHGERKHAHTHGERKHAAIHGERKHGHTHGERKHAHTYGERQYVCQYEGCGKRFTDSSKLKRHFLTHTGEKPFKCSFEGCGKLFALDFNLKVHMKTHCPENYHVCSYPECGKRFIRESKLNSHIKAHQQKNMATKNTPTATKHNNVPKTHSAANYRSASVARPYVCPHEGCSKAYIHEYKLNLHLRSTHAGNDSKCTLATTNHAIAQGIDPHRANLKRSNPMTTHMMPPPKLPNRMGSSFNAVNKQWPVDGMYEDDSEGSYENAQVGRRRYPGESEDEDPGESEDEDEETEDEN